jgi:hypothetical protein
VAAIISAAEPTASQLPPAASMPDLALNDSPAEAQEDAAPSPAAPVAGAKAKAAPKAAAATPPATEAMSGAVRRPEPMPAGPTEAPQPLGGRLALREYLRRSAAEFDPGMNKTHLTGIVHLQFLVGLDGRVSHVKVTRGLRDDYDAEAERIICDGPTWQPGVSGGRRATLPVELTVPF